MTRQAAASLVALLVSHFPSSPFSEANAGAYELYFEQFEVEPLTKALRALIDSSKFLPALSEIRQAVELASRPTLEGCPRCHVSQLNGRRPIVNGRCSLCGWQERKELVS